MKIVSMFCPSEALNSWLCFVQKIAFEQSSCFLVFIVAVLSNIQLTSHRFNFLTSVEPDQAPADVEVWTPHSTRLDVSWNEVPNGYKNGIIRGYKIQYAEMMDNGSVETEDLEPWKRSLSITGLKKFTLYNITVLSYTTKGDGASYSKVIMTNQDGMFPLRTTICFLFFYCESKHYEQHTSFNLSRGETVFYHNFKYLGESLLCDALGSVFDELQGVWKCLKTQFVVFDISFRSKL